MKGNRWLVLSVLAMGGAFLLAWFQHSPATFADVAMVALGGGHLTNVAERWKAQPADTEIPESA